MNGLRRLWAGELPLRQAFWDWAVLGGIAVNMITSFLFLILVSFDWPILALIIGYGGSVPYNIVAVVGVWRAASHDHGNPTLANIYRLVTLIGMIVLTIT